MEIGNFLKELRGKMSLREASERSGLSHSYIRYLEIGKRPGSNTPINPTPETLKALAKAYDYPYNELMEVAGYIDETPSHKTHLDQQHPDESFFFFDEEKVTEEEREALKEHLKFLRWKAAQENKGKG